MPAIKRTLTPLPHRAVRLTGGLWAERTRINRETTLPIELEQCKRTGRLAAFKLKWKPGRPKQPHVFWDSDVAKWIEAAGYSLATHPDKALERKADRVIADIEKAQQADGYINTHFTVVAPEKRWSNLRDDHELYCAGHLIEAAVAYAEGTGKRKLLDVMCRYADYIGTVFGRGKGQLRGYPGHQEIELALVKLYRVTGEKRYLTLAAYFINERGRKPSYFRKEALQRAQTPRGFYLGDDSYEQAHRPVREQTEAVGHAVRACYMYAGMADVAAETGDAELLRACKTLWKNITEKRMYIHGGVGSTHHGEQFTFDYDLPNEIAYAETCAAISLVLFAHRMLQIECDSRYTDVIERCLHNGILSGVSQSGDRFFYANYLASVPEAYKFHGRFSPERSPWFGCACCPPNIARLLANVGGYFYSQTERAVFVHLYGENEARVTVRGQEVTLRQRTAYPWDEVVDMQLALERPAAFTLALRLPGWCRKPTLTVNGKRVKPTVRKGYAMLRQMWQSGDRVELTLPMPVERIEAHPAVRHDAGRVALMRGPVLYCLEETDNGKYLNDIALDPQAAVKVVRDKSLGVPVLQTGGCKRKASGWGGTLYRPASSSRIRTTLRAVPYYLWANRGPGEMLVWLRQEG